MSLLNKIVEASLKKFFSLKQDDWVERIAQPNEWQDDCDKFDGRYFIVKHMPPYPQRVNCQRKLEKIEKPVPNVTAKAD